MLLPVSVPAAPVPEAPPDVAPDALLPLAPVPLADPDMPPFVLLAEPDVPPFALPDAEPRVAPVEALPDPLMPPVVLLLAPDWLEFEEPMPALPALELCAYTIPTANDIIPADAAIIHLFIEHLSFR